jgi:hypothetical protein
MDKDFTLYEEALELKPLGFDEPCLAFYNGKFLESTQYRFYDCSMMDIGQCLLAPTYSQTFRWFREKYGLYPDIHRIGAGGKFLACIENLITGNSLEMVMDEPVDYEEAELASLKKLIKIVKNK